MKNIIILIGLIIAFANCHGKVKGDSNIKKRDAIKTSIYDYPLEIKHIGAQKLYDKAKWTLYCIHSDEIVKFASTNSRDSLTFGTLPLIFDRVSLKQDTIEIRFNFFFGKTKLNYMTVRNKLISGVVFKGYTDTLIYYATDGDAPYFYWYCGNQNDCPYRFGKPLQPEVIKYIRENKARIDPWFRKEAIKRGVIK